MKRNLQERNMTLSRTYILQDLLSAAKQSQRDLLVKLEELVLIESPSENKAAVDRASRLVAGWLQEVGGRVRWHKQQEFGDLLEVRIGRVGSVTAKSAPRKPVLLLGHLDTVWPMGTLAAMPFRVTKERAFGPGIFDMKAGAVIAVQALTMLRDAKASHAPVVVLLNSDEEVGSPCSRAVTEKLARECSAVFVLEPAQGPQGAYKTARKGVGQYSVHVRGVAAHSGVDFEVGHSAVLELARLIEKIAQFTDLTIGMTVNAGLMRGGTRVNVVAAEAWAEIDVRIARTRDAGRIERLFRALRPADRACSVTIAGGVNRPPMERGSGTVKLFRRAKKLADALGFTLEEASTGGGSDGNFTAALGIATLDGMGAVGEGAHAAHESILLAALAPRTALLAAMIAEFQD
jgi:glutamate carboxypeptidase